MRITKFGHACVRIEYDDQVLVIDPGSFTDPAAVDGATAVLVTHEHPDHFYPPHLSATDAHVWTIASVAEQVRAGATELEERLTVVSPGEEFHAGLPVRAVGERHAVIHESVPVISNTGVVVTVGDTTLFHPGDSFELPGEPIDVFCLPVSGPWTKAGQVLDHALAVGAPRVLAIHERVLSDAGLGMLDNLLASSLEGTDYHRLADGEDLPL